jgi:uncharacterized protein involved in exopolysaccharide biosynthesis
MTVPTASAAGGANLWLTQRPEMLKSAVEVFKEESVPGEVVAEFEQDADRARAEGATPIPLVYYPDLAELTGFDRVRYSVIAVGSWIKRIPEMIGIKKKLTEQERLVGAVKSSLQIEPVPGTDVLTFSLTWGSPGLPQLLLDKVVDAMRERHLRAFTTPGTAAFFEEQVAKLEGALRQVRGEIAAYEQAHGIVDITQQQKTNLETLAQLRQKETSIRLERVEARSPRDMAMAEQKLLRVQEDVRKLMAEMSQLDAYAKQLEDLNLQLRILTDDYKLYRKDQEAARIAEAQDQARLVSFSVIQEPTPAFEPIRPRFWLNTGLGFAISLLVALLAAFYYDYLKHALDGPDDVRRDLGMRVLGTRSFDPALAE